MGDGEGGNENKLERVSKISLTLQPKEAFLGEEEGREMKMGLRVRGSDWQRRK